MTIALVDSGTFPFTDGSSGHVCDLGSAPAAGDLDVLCVNSNTVVSTPDGFTLVATAVTNQGAYIFARIADGAEGSTVTVTTPGGATEPTVVGWSRWSGVDDLDAGNATQANGSAGNATPDHTTDTLAGDGDELVIAMGAMSSIGSANQTTPVWSSGYTGLTEDTEGSGATGVYQAVGYRTDAGPAAESPQVSWSGDGAQNRYMLTAAFTALAGGTAHAVSGTIAATSGASLTAHRVRPVSGTIAGSSGASLTAHRVRPVSGTIAAVSTVSLRLSGSATVYVKRGGTAVLTEVAGALKRGGQVYAF